MTSLLSDTPTPPAEATPPNEARSLTDAPPNDAPSLPGAAPLPNTSLRTEDALLGSHSADAYAELMHEVVDALAQRFTSVDAPTSANDRTSLEAEVADFDLDGQGIGNIAALREADDLYARNAVWFHHPSYVAHLNCPVAVPAVAAEAMLAAINTSVDTYDQSEVATLMERRLVQWACRHVGFSGGDGIFTSGGTQSNLQALFLARENVLRAQQAQVLGSAQPGRGEPSRRELMSRLRILTTSQTHFSISRAAHILGLDAEAVVTVDTDAAGRMDAEALAELMRDIDDTGGIVMAVAATAGTTDLGVIDPLDAIAEICENANVWMHVDAAYGGGLLWAPRRKHLLQGIGRATSVTIDFHKTFFQPVSSSALLVRELALFDPTLHHNDYLNPEAEAQGADAEPNQVDKSLQTTRRFDALKLWTTLRARGATEIGSMVDAVCDLAAEVRELLEAQPDFEVLGATDLSTVLFRFAPATAEAATADELVPMIRRVLFRSGRAAIARTTIDGTPWLKLTLLNPDTTVADITAVLDLVRATGHGILAGRHLESTTLEGGAA
ncbi:pyridoxal phosphate-dependent decarboxylase family protein [Brevibacterium sp. UCMA 11754]|uniref:pyridoxal phosphate-dependent decarboxylase family protein n=1 Tax=Brevibacterium sp. UCMA 11754 TaxID=2749198 RepID=UPI001F3D609F|nr:pyridoxal-dependent decarboxylase [Brevibacterium sp. UCMA 11754]MCF2573755.1 aminotransferase class V-fold PLP-dependent enzyme [Brevibacterium sp. UCMA 11754]